MNEEFERTLNAWAGVMKKTAAEATREAARRFVREVRKATPPFAGGGTRKTHTDFLKKRILEMRLPRGRLTKALRARHMSKREARAYFRKAREMQGGLVSGWNAAAEALGVKFPAWISRHGGKYGSARFREDAVRSRIDITFRDASKSERRADMDRIARRALERVRAGMMRNIRKKVERVRA